MSTSGHRPFIPAPATLLSLVFFLGLIISTHAFADSQYSFYYFNPDSAQSNMVRLKGEMDTFLHHTEMPLVFTPFSRFNDFDRLTKNEPPCFAFFPKWYLDQDKNPVFTPLLEPVRNGSTHYQKVLLTNLKSDISLQNINKKTLATTSFGPQGEALLNKVLFKQHNIDIKNLNIIITPKDSDALFALALGQVEMALVSQNNLDHISIVNPRVTQTLRTLSTTEPIPMPILCYRKGAVSAAYIEKMKKVFLQATRKTNKIMEMLQIDAWQLSTSR